jgi:hypothetical protein
MPWSITALVAFDTRPQFSVLDWPALIVPGLAVKDAITGGGVCVGVGEDIMADTGVGVGVTHGVGVGVSVSRGGAATEIITSRRGI